MEDHGVMHPRHISTLKCSTIVFGVHSSLTILTRIHSRLTRQTITVLIVERLNLHNFLIQLFTQVAELREFHSSLVRSWIGLFPKQILSHQF